MKLAALCLVLVGGAARAQDGGVSGTWEDAPRIISVRSGLLLSDDGQRFEVDGGAWLRDDTLLDRARDLERLAAENRQLRATPTPTPLWVLVTNAASVVAGVALGAWAAFNVCRETALCR